MSTRYVKGVLFINTRIEWVTFSFKNATKEGKGLDFKAELF